MSAQHTRHRGDPTDWLFDEPPEPVIPRHSMLPPDPGRHRAPQPARRSPRHIDWARLVGTTATVIVTLGGWTVAAIQTHHLHQAQAAAVAAMNDRTDLQAAVQSACVNTAGPLDLTEWVPVCQAVMPTTAPEDLDRTDAP